MGKIGSILKAIKRYKTARYVWGYLIFSLILSLYFVFKSENTNWVFTYTVPFIFMALAMGYVSYRVYMHTKEYLIHFYKEAATNINTVVADVGKPYRRGALYQPQMIEDIVEGNDVYKIYSAFLTRSRVPSNIYEHMIKYESVGEYVFWGTFLDMVKAGIVVTNNIPEGDGDIILYVKKCDGISLVLDEVCDVLKKASVREKSEISYDKEIYKCALHLSTMEKYLSEVDINLNVDGERMPITRVQHISILLYNHLIAEFTPPKPFDKYPPFTLPRRASLVVDKYKSTYSLSYFMSTLAWAIPYFGLTYFAFLAAIVGFSVAYLYVPSGIYHPSIPWYNRFRVWQYMRKKVSGIYPEHMSTRDAISYVTSFPDEADHFLLATYIGVVNIGV
ncbi:hypothetical protein GM182_07640 [bacterium 3DAC]|nr:hypothetical protein GM182_07640 [bacterium 3DAC]